MAVESDLEFSLVQVRELHLFRLSFIPFIPHLLYLFKKCVCVCGMIRFFRRMRLLEVDPVVECTYCEARHSTFP